MPPNNPSENQSPGTQRRQDLVGRREATRASTMGPMSLEQAALLSRSAQMYPDAPAGFHVAAANMPDGDALMDVASMRAADAAGRKKKPKRSLWGKALGGAGSVIGATAGAVKTVGGAVLPDQAEAVLHPIEDNIGERIGEGLPMLARGAGVVAEAPLQTAIGTARQVTGLVQGKQQWEGWNNFGNEIAAQTTLGQVFEQWGLPGAPEATGNGGVDLGEGFLPGGAVVAERVEAERQAANLIGNSAWTPGRALAQGLGYDTDSTAFNVVSGMSDFAVSWFGDPTNKLLEVGAEGSRVAKLGSEIVGEEAVAKAAVKAAPAWKTTVDEALGIIPGTYKSPRDSVLKSQAAKWLYGNQGRQAVEHWKGVTSTSEIWRETGQKWPISLARAVAESDDEVEIANLLATAFTSGVRDLPGTTRGVTGMADQIVKSRQANGRLFNMVPDTRIEWDNIEQSFRNLDDSAANVGMHGELRKNMLDEFAYALTQPRPKFQARYEAIGIWGKALETHLRSVGVPDSLAEAATQWTRKLDALNQYDVDDIAHGIGFRPDEGSGPFLVTQLLNTGLYLYDPKKIRELRELTGQPMFRFIQRNRTWRGVHSLAAGYQTELWKPMQLIGPKYLAKALPDERIRVMFGGAIEGPFGWLQTVFGDQYGLRPDGGIFQSHAQRANALVEEKDVLLDRLPRIIDPIETKVAKSRLAAIEQEMFTLNEEIASSADDAYSSAMAYKGKYGANAMFEDARADRLKADEYDRLVDQQYRRGDRQTANYSQLPNEWAIGTGESIIGLSKDPVAIRVARGGLNPGDDPTGIFRPGLDGIIDWLNMGEGRVFREAMEEYKPGSAGRNMVESAADDIFYRTGNDPELLEAIATGKIKGASIGTNSAVKGFNPSAELRDHLNLVAQTNQDISKYASFVPTEITRTTKSGRDLNRALELKDDFTRFFFQSAFGKSSDKLNRDPAFRSFVWRRAEELAPHMDPAEAQKMYQTARGILPEGQLKRLKAAVDEAAGDLSAEDVNQLAGHAALEDVTDLLFDVNNRTQLFDIVRVIMPFGEAWREIITSYARLIRQNPRIMRRFQQTVNGLRGGGFMYQNEYGEESIGLKGSGALVSAWTGGAIKADMSMAAKSLSIGTSVIPGLGPVASMPVYRLIPDEPGTEWVRQTLFPYGEPSGLDAIPIPAWARKFTEAVGWTDGKTAAATGNQVMNQLYTKDPERYANDIELLIQDTNAVSTGVLMARGIAQMFSPGAPQMRYIAETKEGDVAAMKLSAEFRRLQLSEDEGGEGLDNEDAIAEFLETYGDGAALYISGNTETKAKGIDPSKEFADFERGNGWLFDKHTEIAGYFGPHGGEFDYFTYVRQLEAGYRRSLTPNERLAAANQIVGNMRVRAAESELPPRDEWGPFERAYMDDVKTQTEKDLFGYTRYDAFDVNQMNRQIEEVFTASEDKRLNDNDVAGAVRQYRAEHDQVMEQVREAGYASLSAKAMTFQRAYLQSVGEQLREQVAGFGTVWDRLLSREVESPE